MGEGKHAKCGNAAQVVSSSGIRAEYQGTVLGEGKAVRRELQEILKLHRILAQNWYCSELR